MCIRDRYLGFHFICSWDEDHDYGVMMHKERVVKMGGGDVAFLSWIAEEEDVYKRQSYTCFLRISPPEKYSIS